jgi:ferrochelatase
MRDAGVKSALAYVTSAYSSWSGCRQYRENIEAARAEIGDDAPQVDKIRVFYNHPDFVAASADRLREALGQIPEDRRTAARIAFTAHSIPNSMADTCDYVKQLTETCRLVAESVGISDERLDLVYQSRSGRPQDPWLEPDIVDHLKSLHGAGVADVVVAPVGFLSDHMEVLFDLDEEAALACQEMGLNMVRAGTVGSHPQFVQMLRKLIQERLADAPRDCVGRFGPNHDVCPVDCCPGPPRRPAAGPPSSAQPSP